MTAKFSKRKYIVWVYALFLMIASGCQAVQPTVTAIVTLEPSATSVVQATQTVTVSGVASATPMLTATPSLVPTQPTSTALLADQRWLAYSYKGGISAVNQDGSGRLLIGQPTDNFFGYDCTNPNDSFMLDENPLNRMVAFGGAVYLIQPPAFGRFYKSYPGCNFAFSRGANGSEPLLLAYIDGGEQVRTTPPLFLLSAKRQGDEGSRTLIIYELPSGKIHSRIPLVNCAPEAPECGQHFRPWQLAWSPNGRYLAYPAIQDGTSTDLFVYDRNTGNTRRLTNGPEEVKEFQWSPDGTWLFMSEELGMLSDKDYIPSFWAVSVVSDEIRFLYTPIINYPADNFLRWIDNNRLLTYSGTIECCGPPDAGGNLTLVKLNGEAPKVIFAGAFVGLTLDNANHRVVLQKPQSDSLAIYIVSMSDGTSTKVDDSVLSLGQWDSKLKLYVTDEDCTDHPGQRQAFDLRGKAQCLLVPDPPVPTPNASALGISPDNRWQILLTSSGVKLKDLSDQSEKLITNNVGTQVIWCPDSSCFFFVSNRTLYNVFISNLALNPVDKDLGQDTIDAQWIEKPAPN